MRLSKLSEFWLFGVFVSVMFVGGLLQNATLEIVLVRQLEESFLVAVDIGAVQEPLTPLRDDRP